MEPGFNLYVPAVLLYDASIMTTEEIRSAYLQFFKDKKHAVLASSSLVPENDSTTLFTGSGMQPIVPYLLGEVHPLGDKLVNSQKCFRSQDIDEVGDNRHTTFFEMLGNWSLGDYFKKEQISWMFEFLTENLSLDPSNLYITAYRGNVDLNIPKDEETALLWQDLFKTKNIEAKIGEDAEKNGMLPGERIFYYSEKKNWWSRAGVPSNMPTGEPGGPDTEMFWDFEPDVEKRTLHTQSVWKNEPCHVNCDCGRFIEIGNNVFMQYIKTDTGFEELAQKNVDFGGGLERLTAATQNNPDVFMTNVFEAARKKIEELSGQPYNSQSHYAYRVILDHLRAATFLIGDGVFPSNKDQGYFVRRLIRRAVRFANTLGVQAEICAHIAACFINNYQQAYPALKDQEVIIFQELAKEEKKFQKTLVQGVKKFEELKSKTSDQIISGLDAFDLLQSFGFPIELTTELAQEQGFAVDLETFTKEKEKHQALSRAGSEQKFKGGLADHSDMSVKYHTATHLLHQALRNILGEKVEQKGSNITPERLRFDFSYPEKLTPEQIAQAEEFVNNAIEKALPVEFKLLTLPEAQAIGAIGLFTDKYAEVGDQIKVYFVGDASKGDVVSTEVCGGPHVENTKILGKFHIQKEESVGTGLRRIKAILE